MAKFGVIEGEDTDLGEKGKERGREGTGKN